MPQPIALSGFQAPPLDALPVGPLLERWLFEDPLLPGALVLVLTIVGFIVLGRMDRARPALLLALGGAVVVIGLLAADRGVVTGRERLARAAHELVRAVAEPDLPSAGAALDESARLNLVGVGQGVSKASILKQIPRLHAGARLGDWRVPTVHAGLFSDTIGRTQIRFKPDAPGLPRDSWWRVDWALQTAPDGTPRWRATHIEPIWISGVANPDG